MKKLFSLLTLVLTVALAVSMSTSNELETVEQFGIEIPLQDVEGMNAQEYVDYLNENYAEGGCTFDFVDECRVIKTCNGGLGRLQWIRPLDGNTCYENGEELEIKEQLVDTPTDVEAESAVAVPCE